MKRFVYYNCTRRKDPNCKEKYINENNLCEIMKGFIEANYTQIRINEKLKAKVNKHMYITKTLLAHYKIDQKLDEPLIEYARYVLMNGTESEKTGLAAGMETILQIRHGKLEFYKAT